MKTRSRSLVHCCATFTAIASLSTLLPAQDARNRGNANNREPADVRAAPDNRPAVTRADLPAGTSTDLAQGIYIASIDAENRSLRRYAGLPLRNHEGAKLGDIKDFIIHPATSRVRYAVVSSGGLLGMGNRLRLVPVDVMQRSDDGTAYSVHILQSQWLEIPPVSDTNYVRDELGITAAQHRATFERFGTADANAAPGNDNPRVARANDARRPVANGSAAAAADTDFMGLVRASMLRGKTVHIDGQIVGNIEDLIIDLDARTVAALLDSGGEFTGTVAKYLVPISRLVFQNPRQNPITAQLTRADFDRARASEPPLAPTGR